MANETTTTQITESINSEWIELKALLPNRKAVIFEDLAKLYINPGNWHSGVVTQTIWDEIAFTETEASGKTEAASTANQAQTLSQVQMTGVTVSTARVLTDEAEMDSLLDLPRGLVEQAFAELAQRMNTDFLLNILDASNTENYSGNDFNLTRWGTAAAAWRLLDPSGEVAFVAHPHVMADLFASARANGNQVVANNMGAINQRARGYVGELENVSLYESSAAPEFDSNNWSSAFMVPGETIGMALWKAPHVESQRQAREAQTEYFVRSRYGTNPVLQGNLLEVVTSKV